MIASSLLGASARNCKETAHGGVHQDLSWGGIPIVILVGDDHQLPPVEIGGKGKGAFYVLSGRDNCVNSNWGSHVESLGVSQFLELTDTVSALSKVERQDVGNTEHTSLLTNLRPPNKLTRSQVNRLLRLDVKTLRAETNDDITENSMHIYAFKDDAKKWNRKCVVEKSSATNPVAMLKGSGKSSASRLGKVIHSHFNNEQTPLSTNIFHGARVSIRGRNFVPEWGLFNGAIGTVDEIVFKDDESPNDNNLPLYVAVHFENYTGPVWDPQNPKVVPIPIINVPCNRDHRCCSLNVCPLVPAYATTIHKFQGQSAGPTRKGQKVNEVQRIVCCPGTILFESQNPGLLYTLISRATTIGTPGQDDSAIYFIGDFIEEPRLTNIHLTRDGKVYDKVQRRDKWINHLQSRLKPFNISDEEQNQLFQWASCETTRYTKDELNEIIDTVSPRFKHI